MLYPHKQTPTRESNAMRYTIADQIEIESLLQPETALERQLLQAPEFRKGLMWGKPLYLY